MTGNITTKSVQVVAEVMTVDVKTAKETKMKRETENEVTDMMIDEVKGKAGDEVTAKGMGVVNKNYIIVLFKFEMIKIYVINILDNVIESSSPPRRRRSRSTSRDRYRSSDDRRRRDRERDRDRDRSSRYRRRYN